MSEFSLQDLYLETYDSAKLLGQGSYVNVLNIPFEDWENGVFRISKIYFNQRYTPEHNRDELFAHLSSTSATRGSKPVIVDYNLPKDLNFGQVLIFDKGNYDLNISNPLGINLKSYHTSLRDFSMELNKSEIDPSKNVDKYLAFLNEFPKKSFENLLHMLSVVVQSGRYDDYYNPANFVFNKEKDLRAVDFEIREGKNPHNPPIAYIALHIFTAHFFSKKEPDRNGNCYDSELNFELNIKQKDKLHDFLSNFINTMHENNFETYHTEKGENILKAELNAIFGEEYKGKTNKLISSVKKLKSPEKHSLFIPSPKIVEVLDYKMPAFKVLEHLKKFHPSF
jgi:hypothetical protein